MQQRPLGRTGLTVSELGFGAWAIGGNAHGNSYGPTDDAVSRAALQRALDLGCTFFDTADVYGHGHSEELLGEVIGQRQDVVIATKGGGAYMYGDSRWGQVNFSPPYIRFAVEQSLQRLRRDRIDLYQLHNPSLELIVDGRVFDVLEELKQEGKVRAYGVSIHRPEEGIAAIREGRPQAIQVVYNLFSQSPEERLFPMAQQAGIAIIAREPLANGYLTGKHTDADAFAQGDIRHDWPRQSVAARVRAAGALRFLEAGGQRTLAQAALRFCLDHPAVSAVIPGAKTPEQVEENLRAAAVPPLALAERTQIDRILFGRSGSGM